MRAFNNHYDDVA